ncbi:colicin immunity domain-containing protein [Amycolatopsis nivea]|uniref:colicin immunity domain-containing protein n=1 Tax=Amycolatopsis nivea TaxID=1644109 RepID=UPI0010706571|nr:colicin immunity domain-containing protein [Amycolatopsis nivea]
MSESEENKRDADDYGELIGRFVDRTIDAGQFEQQYLDLMKNDEALRPDDVFAVLDALFSEVDEYFVSPEASPAERRDLDEALRQHAAAALARLHRLGALG